MASLTVSPTPVAPTITAQPTNQSVTAPATTNFSVVGTGTPTPTYQWLMSVDNGATFTNINGATSARYITPATQLTDNGKILRASLSNSAGTVFSNSAVLTVGAALRSPIFSTSPSNANVTAPAAATFSSLANANPAPKYQWQISNDGGNTFIDLFGAVGPSYTTPATSTLDNGAIYRVVAENQIGKLTSLGATLMVTAPLLPGPGLVLSQQFDLSKGSTIQISAPESALNSMAVIFPSAAADVTGYDTVSISYSRSPPGLINSQALSAGAKVVSKSITVGHSSLISFARPVRITIPYNKSDVASNEYPIVAIWDQALSRYDAVTVRSISRTDGTITFLTRQLGTFVAVNFSSSLSPLASLSVAKRATTTIRALGQARKAANGPTPDIDTGFSPILDGFPVSNFSTQTGDASGGACYGLTSFSAWYFDTQRNMYGPMYSLFDKSTTKLPSNPLEDDVARELIYKTYSDTLTANKATSVAELNPTWSVEEADLAAASFLVNAMLLTHQPQLLDLWSNRDYDKPGTAHSVLVYGWSGDPNYTGVLVYDPNYPGEPQFIAWNPPLTNGAAGSFVPYRGAYKLFLHAAKTLYYDPSGMASNFDFALKGWPKKHFNSIAIKNPTFDSFKVPKMSFPVSLTGQTVIEGSINPARLSMVLTAQGKVFANIFRDQKFLDAVPVDGATGKFQFAVEPIAAGKFSSEILIAIAGAAATVNDKGDSGISSGFEGFLRATLLPNVNIEFENNIVAGAPGSADIFQVDKQSVGEAREGQEASIRVIRPVKVGDAIVRLRG